MKIRFERGALAAVAGLVASLILVVVLSPLDRSTSSPKASIRLAISQLVPAKPVPVEVKIVSGQVSLPDDGSMEETEGFMARVAKVMAELVAEVKAKVTPVMPKMAGIDTLTGVMSGNADDRFAHAELLKSPGVLTETFRQLGYDLDSVGAGKAEVPRLFLASLPGDLKEVPETHVRKSLFFQAVLPLVLQANEEILRDRRRLWNIHYQQSLGQKPGPADRLWLKVMAERYDVKKSGIEALLKRVDIIPPSLALAQAAEESGWGTSRFVRDGNAVFGQWTFSETGSLVPAKRDNGKSHKIKAFSSLLDSVRSYVHNLNTHAAYRQMRRVRQGLRLIGAPLEGLLLAENLKSYSQRGGEYVETIKVLIKTNNLHLLDDARLRVPTQPQVGSSDA